MCLKWRSPEHAERKEVFKKTAIPFQMNFQFQAFVTHLPQTHNAE